MDKTWPAAQVWSVQEAVILVVTAAVPTPWHGVQGLGLHGQVGCGRPQEPQGPIWRWGPRQSQRRATHEPHAEVPGKVQVPDQQDEGRHETSMSLELIALPRGWRNPPRPRPWGWSWGCRRAEPASGSRHGSTAAESQHLNVTLAKDSNTATSTLTFLSFIFWRPSKNCFTRLKKSSRSGWIQTSDTRARSTQIRRRVLGTAQLSNHLWSPRPADIVDTQFCNLHYPVSPLMTSLIA